MTSAARPRLGTGLVLGAGVLFGLNAGISRVAMSTDLSPQAFTSLRVTGATLVFALVALVTRRAALRPPSGRAFWLVAALGLVGVAALQLTYNVAIDRLPLGIALLLEYLAPVLVVVWARLVQHDDVAARLWSAVGLTVVGIAVVGRVWEGLEFDGLGVAMALLAALAFAAYFLIGERTMDTDPAVGGEPLQVILWAFVWAAVAMNLASPAWTARGLDDHVTLLGRLDGLSAPLWLVVLWVVVLGTVVPFFLELVALQLLPATVVTLLATIEPVIAVITGWAWFRESLTTLQVAGCVAVVGGILLAQSARRARITIAPPSPV